MLWTGEGFVLDDAGNMLTTTHIDLRDKEERTVIRSLVKGCNTWSMPWRTARPCSSRSRHDSGNTVWDCIRDEQEGFA